MCGEGRKNGTKRVLRHLAKTPFGASRRAIPPTDTVGETFDDFSVFQDH
jgi:hypothetical protein